MNKSVHCLKYVANSLRKTNSSIYNYKSTAAATNISNKTSLYDFHQLHNGKMVNFGGYLLPVQYGQTGITASHLHTRNHASIFDVSHMLQTYVRGADAIECFEQICTADISGLPENAGTLSIFTNAEGGIIDDLIVTKLGPKELYIVSNAGRKSTDKAIMCASINDFKKMGKDVSITFLEPCDRALIAVQGPEACFAVQQLCDTILLDNLYFMRTTTDTISGVKDCRITRCGYTGSFK